MWAEHCDRAIDMLFWSVERNRKSFPLAEQTMPTAASGLQTIDRALDVLCAFEGKDELGISELSRMLKLPKSAVYRVVLTLASRGFVEQNAKRRYRLGLKMLELGNLCRLRLDL